MTVSGDRYRLAYLRPLPRCCEPLCEKGATAQLYTGFNEALDVYCHLHGSAALRQLRDHEQKTQGYPPDRSPVG